MRISNLWNMSKSLFWGDRPLPEDSELKGVIESEEWPDGSPAETKRRDVRAGDGRYLRIRNQDKIRRKLKEA